ncbi:ependymin-like isoform X2 [Thalassophryne amazonica]|uniref:ependymin-like isoform X2 n=1 Tax=Thalassophryne amazonica TaxID=390379 RepID=UPI0014726AA0|nr:ependymin-like isoform X2 [Thalassophryne amazonica]
MRVFVVLSCLLVLACEAQKPHPCRTPPLMTGDFTVSTQNEKLQEFAKYIYDGLGQRIRLLQMGTYDNKTFTYDVLLLFKQGVMFEIDDKAQTCQKKPLQGSFVPWQIPQNASFVAQSVLGTSSQPGAGLLINSWYGTDSPPVKYFSTVTEYACVPVSSAIHIDKFGWILITFFNNVIGITDPQKLNPPAFCPKSNTHLKEEPVDLITLLMNKR